MSALICMASYCTDENDRLKYAVRTVENILRTVDLTRHTLAVYLNSPNNATIAFYRGVQSANHGLNIRLWVDGNNVGTAKAINHLINNYRRGDQPVIKMDDDCVVERTGWVDRMEAAINRDPKLGVLGLKRVDLEQHPAHTTHFFKSELRMLPHVKGEKWIVVEQSADIMGTCTMLSPALLDAVGFYRQPNEYGYDDSDMNIRSLMSGFYNAFLCNEDIEHIDAGENTAYFEFKQQRASQGGAEYQKYISDYKLGLTPLYYNPFE